VYRLQSGSIAPPVVATGQPSSLQRLLMTSKAARYLAVRRVTQDNHGKRTAGIDGSNPSARRIVPACRTIASPTGHQSATN
jgi:hypothetical protein